MPPADELTILLSKFAFGSDQGKVLWVGRSGFVLERLSEFLRMSLSLLLTMWLGISLDLFLGDSTLGLVVLRLDRGLSLICSSIEFGCRSEGSPKIGVGITLVLAITLLVPLFST